MSERHRSKQRAVALRYEQREAAAPVVTASGQGAVAERILALAREHGVPIHADRELMEVLSKLELGDEIPPALYAVVAEVLAFVYRVNVQMGRGGGGRAVPGGAPPGRRAVDRYGLR